MEKNRILIVTNYFFPEEFKINDLAFDLVSKGYKIEVVTGIPNYPKGKFFRGYGFFRKNIENYNGLKIIRLPLISRGSGSKLRLILNYISFFVSLFFYSIYLAFFKKFDVILVHHVSPIFLGIPAVIIKKVQGIKMIFWNLDLWPEAVSHYLKSNWFNKLVTYLLNLIVNFIYENTDKLLISSKSFKLHATSRGYKKENIVYFPNWAEDIYITKNISLLNTPISKFPKNAFKIMFAGNIGEGQDMNSVFKAIEYTSKIDKDIFWIFLGDGRMKSSFEKKIKVNKLEKFVKFLGRQPLNHMPAFFKNADAMLLPLLDGDVYNKTVPAKLQAYMASKKPVLGMLNGEGASVISKSKCGLVANSGNYIDLCNNILKLKNDTNSLEKFSLNSVNYYNLHYSKNNALKKVITIFKSFKLNC
ncbi:glycosyltransferase family 4 protein [Flavobacteriaceae bacterium]|nr:glycosyltransferase family 4 protein [Flavobacteriaceae bacterium]MDC3221391.1 glycosyltransferase family 4 protein [Flavobacteriaceae bacterium]